LIPVLNRPKRVNPLVENLKECSALIECRPVFLVSPGDEAELKIIQKAKVEHFVMEQNPTQGDYAKKINLGFFMTDDPFVFMGADDLIFYPGWAERAIAKWYETGACVIGTNDLGNQRVMEGRHSTHTLVHRGYGDCGTCDEEGVLLHEGYWHQFVDDEFVGTAMARGVYTHAEDSIVEHLHPHWGKAPEDDTYRLSMKHFNEDRNYFNRRAPLWWKDPNG
jgi:hypothetical protein